MRNGFWLTIIGLALAAIVAGYLEGSATSGPLPIPARHPEARITSHPVRVDTTGEGIHQSSDEAVVDLFSDDEVVIERPEASPMARHPEQVSFVVGLCGASLVVESGFFRLGVPIAIDLDPDAPDATRVARAARDAGAPLFVHESDPPNGADLAELRSRLGDFDGIAGRHGNGMAGALAGSGLAYFDERGDASTGSFARLGVRLVRRDTTVDDRAAESYIEYMLDLAAARSVRQGPVVVLMRPMPETLLAVKNFLQTHNPEIISVE